jgi:dTDP-4-amino-4,6-dideoxygalactose transaminase
LTELSIPYGRQSVNEDDIAAVVETLRGDWLTMGPHVASFEEAIAARVGTSDSVVVSSGTAALHAAYAATGVGQGDEVITSPMTFIATASTAILQGAKVFFADIQADTGNINPAAVSALVSEKTRVVAAVDYAGHPADLDELGAIAHARGALLLEDAAHSIASLYRGRPVGSIADVTTFSFFPTKNLTTAEGGAIVSTDEALLDRARKFRMHGLVRDTARQRYPDEGPWHQEVHEFGLNYRLPDVLSALGTSQLGRLDTFKAQRSRIFARYLEGLADLQGIMLPAQRAYVDPMWHLFPLRVKDGQRRRVFDYLRANGVLVQVNYIPVYWHPVFEDLGYRRGMCPVAEAYYSEEISLPMYSALTESDQDRVIATVRAALAE